MSSILSSQLVVGSLGKITVTKMKILFFNFISFVIEKSSSEWRWWWISNSFDNAN